MLMHTQVQSISSSAMARHGLANVSDTSNFCYTQIELIRFAGTIAASRGGYITANSRTYPDDPAWYVFDHSTVR